MSNILKMFARGGAIAAPTDEYFNQTTLLLHGDGTNGAQNKTFLDSSTNNFTITRNGNTTQGTFSPFSLADGEWSNYFDGNSDYLTTPVNASLGLGSSDFCIEWWEYRSDANDFRAVLGGNTSYVALYDPIIWPESGNVVCYLSTGGSWNLLSAFSLGSISTNQWVHRALTRSGTTFRGFKDGTLVSTTTASGSVYMSANSWRIGYGQNRGGADTYFGYLSNLRMVIGSPVYTAAFTPSTTPLTNITNTSLLTCQSNRFKDNSTNNFAITVNGNTSVQPFSPFAPSAAYSTSVNGGSGYFDGSGDSLSIPYNADSNLATGSFTVEGWIYPLSWSGYPCMIFWGDAGGGYAQVYISIDQANGSIYAYSGLEPLPGWHIQLNGGVATLNAWTHVAYTRNQSTGVAFLYVNGVQVATATGKTSNLVTPTGSNYIGSRVTTLPWNGYISAVRVTKSIVYSSAFTPPTAPPIPVTNTKFLANFTNAGIFDNTGKNNLETVGNAQIDTAIKKFGTGSIEFNHNTDDRLLLAPSTNLKLSNENFTIECWLNRSATSPGAAPILQMSAGNDTYSMIFGYSGGGNYLIFISSNGSSWDIASSQLLGTVQNGTWVHYALSRSGSTFRAFQNGIQQSTWTSSASIYQQENQVSVGIAQGSQKLSGFIDDLRITKGVARYTSAFTPPDAPFPDQ